MPVSNYERIRGDQMVPPDLNPCHAGGGDPCGENGKCIPDSSADYGGPLGGGGYTCKCFKGKVNAEVLRVCYFIRNISHKLASF